MCHPDDVSDPVGRWVVFLASTTTELQGDEGVSTLYRGIPSNPLGQEPKLKKQSGTDKTVSTFILKTVHLHV